MCVQRVPTQLCYISKMRQQQQQWNVKNYFDKNIKKTATEEKGNLTIGHNK